MYDDRMRLERLLPHPSIVDRPVPYNLFFKRAPLCTQHLSTFVFQNTKQGSAPLRSGTPLPFFFFFFFFFNNVLYRCGKYHSAILFLSTKYRKSQLKWIARDCRSIITFFEKFHVANYLLLGQHSWQNTAARLSFPLRVSKGYLI
jgi:hypothetical protein